MAEYACSQCGYEKTVPDEHIGRQVECPQCQAMNIIQAGLPSAFVSPASSKEPGSAKSLSASAKAGARGFLLLFVSAVLTGTLVLPSVAGFLFVGKDGDGYPLDIFLGVYFIVGGLFGSVAVFVLILIGLLKLKAVYPDDDWRKPSKWAFTGNMIYGVVFLLSLLLPLILQALSRMHFKLKHVDEILMISIGVFQLIELAGLVIYIQNVLGLVRLTGLRLGDERSVVLAKRAGSFFRLFLIGTGLEVLIIVGILVLSKSVNGLPGGVLRTINMGNLVFIFLVMLAYVIFGITTIVAFFSARNAFKNTARD